MIAALFVQDGGCYFGLPDVDPWPESRDARKYDGPWPVVAHPPCERWGRYWSGGPSNHGRYRLGDDEGCFSSALAAVRKWGGVLEHPSGSFAWKAFGLNTPPRSGGWVSADFYGGWTCCVDQGHYGHRAAKATWLYAMAEVSPMTWGPSGIRLDLTKASTDDDRRKLVRRGVCERMSKRQRAATPPEFRDLLISIARSACPS